MATTVTVTVKAAAGDYTTLSAAEAGEQRDLVSADEVSEIACYNLADTTATTFDGWTTDATRYIHIVAVDTHSGVWTTSAYRLVTSGTTACLVLSEDYTHVEGLQIEQQGSGSHAPQGILYYGTRPKAERNLVRCTYSGTNTSAINVGIDLASGGGITPGYASNNIVYGFNAAEPVEASAGIKTGNLAAYVFNNTVYNCTRGIYEAGGDTTYAINNLCAANATADFSGAWHADSNYNAASDATAPGANSRQSQTFTFVSTTGGSEDFHLQTSDAGAKGYGTTLSGHATYPITVDVDGTTRQGTWDIGADQTPYSPNITPGAGLITLTGGQPNGNYPKTNRLALLGIG